MTECGIMKLVDFVIYIKVRIMLILAISLDMDTVRQYQFI